MKNYLSRNNAINFALILHIMFCCFAIGYNLLIYPYCWIELGILAILFSIIHFIFLKPVSYEMLILKSALKFLKEETWYGLCPAFYNSLNLKSNFPIYETINLTFPLFNKEYIFEICELNRLKLPNFRGVYWWYIEDYKVRKQIVRIMIKDLKKAEKYATYKN